MEKEHNKRDQEFGGYIKKIIAYVKTEKGDEYFTTAIKNFAKSYSNLDSIMGTEEIKTESVNAIKSLANMAKSSNGKLVGLETVYFSFQMLGQLLKNPTYLKNSSLNETRNNIAKVINSLKTFSENYRDVNYGYTNEEEQFENINNNINKSFLFQSSNNVPLEKRI